ncbi:unnamed protein product [Schistosoma margrebowiei]|uniref:Uncharacterized protein n=1 Tax=Schistosoma margrebowiei TaxID=48269 RepID=A0AA85ABV4_9TREM|nr:unnamed protein product [Schistosoma margrebowiei]
MHYRTNILAIIPYFIDGKNVENRFQSSPDNGVIIISSYSKQLGKTTLSKYATRIPKIHPGTLCSPLSKSILVLHEQNLL